MKLGFIGLGIMGAPMAAHLIDAGHQLFVNTHGAVPADIAAKQKAYVAAHGPEAPVAKVPQLDGDTIPK